MKLNLYISKIMVFRNGGPLSSYKFSIRPFEFVSFYKYFRLYVTPSPKDTLAKQTRKAMGSTFR